MGAGASVADVSSSIQALGPAYAPYSLQASNNGLDGDLCQSLLDSPEDINETLDLLNVNVKLHRAKLKNELNKVFSSRPPQASPIHAQATAVATVTNATPFSRRSSFTTGTIQVSLSWDGGVDLDLNAVSFTDIGHTLDLVYYGNYETRDRSISHSGDHQGSTSHCSNEEITVRTSQLRPQVAAVALFVRCHDQAASLSAASNVVITVTSPSEPPTIFPLAHHVDAAAVGVLRIYKLDEMWVQDVLDLPVPENDITKIIPVLQSSLRDVLNISASAAVDVVVLDKGGFCQLRGVEQ